MQQLPHLLKQPPALVRPSSLRYAAVSSASVLRTPRSRSRQHSDSTIEIKCQGRTHYEADPCRGVASFDLFSLSVAFEHLCQAQIESEIRRVQSRLRELGSAAAMIVLGEGWRSLQCSSHAVQQL